MLNMPNDVCPICETKIDSQNVSRKENWEGKPVKLDRAGRTICNKCADWLENTEWD